MDSKIKIGFIVMAAFVVGVAGTFSYANFQIPSEHITSQSNPSEQGIGVGAWVIVEAYTDDGTLIKRVEKHNSITSITQNAISACATGIDTSPASFGSCDGWVDSFRLQMQFANDTLYNPQPIQNVTSVKLTPIGCSSDSTNSATNCKGWEITGTFDFVDYSIPSGLNVTSIISGKYVTSPVTTVHTFNFIDLNGSDEIAVNPMDRLFVNMTFNISN